MFTKSGKRYFLIKSYQIWGGGYKHIYCSVLKVAKYSILFPYPRFKGFFEVAHTDKPTVFFHRDVSSVISHVTKIHRAGL